MFGVGGAELAVTAIVVLVGVAAWLSWRDHWVRMSREWYVEVPAEDLQDLVTASLAQVRGGRLRAGGPDGWIYSVSRIPGWALVLGLLTLPLGVLLLLLVREHADLHLRVRPEGGGSRLRAVGRTRSCDADAVESWLTRYAARLTA